MLREIDRGVIGGFDGSVVMEFLNSIAESAGEGASTEKLAEAGNLVLSEDGILDGDQIRRFRIKYGKGIESLIEQDKEGGFSEIGGQTLIVWQDVLREMSL